MPIVLKLTLDDEASETFASLADKADDAAAAEERAGRKAKQAEGSLQRLGRQAKDLGGELGSLGSKIAGIPIPGMEALGTATTIVGDSMEALLSPVGAVVIGVGGLAAATVGAVAGIAALVGAADDWIADLEEIGAADDFLSKDQIDGIISANDAFAALGNSLEILGSTFASGFAPAVERVTDLVSAAILAFSDWLNTGDNLKNTITEVASTIGTILWGAIFGVWGVVVDSLDPIDKWRVVLGEVGSVLETVLIEAIADATAVTSTMVEITLEIASAMADSLGPTLEKTAAGFWFVVDAVSGVTNSIISMLAPAARGAQAATDGASEAASLFGRVLEFALGEAIDDAVSSLNFIKLTITDTIDAFSNLTVVKGLIDLWSGALDEATEVAERFNKQRKENKVLLEEQSDILKDGIETQLESNEIIKTGIDLITGEKSAWDLLSSGVEGAESSLADYIKQVQALKQANADLRIEPPPDPLKNFDYSKLSRDFEKIFAQMDFADFEKNLAAAIEEAIQRRKLEIPVEVTEDIGGALAGPAALGAALAPVLPVAPIVGAVIELGIGLEDKLDSLANQIVDGIIGLVTALPTALAETLPDAVRRLVDELPDAIKEALITILEPGFLTSFFQELFFALRVELPLAIAEGILQALKTTLFRVLGLDDDGKGKVTAEGVAKGVATVFAGPVIGPAIVEGVSRATSRSDGRGSAAREVRRQGRRGNLGQQAGNVTFKAFMADRQGVREAVRHLNRNLGPRRANLSFNAGSIDG